MFSNSVPYMPPFGNVTTTAVSTARDHERGISGLSFVTATQHAAILLQPSAFDKVKLPILLPDPIESAPAADESNSNKVEATQTQQLLALRSHSSSILCNNAQEESSCTILNMGAIMANEDAISIIQHDQEQSSFDKKYGSQQQSIIVIDEQSR